LIDNDVEVLRQIDFLSNIVTEQIGSYMLDVGNGSKSAEVSPTLADVETYFSIINDQITENLEPNMSYMSLSPLYNTSSKFILKNKDMKDQLNVNVNHEIIQYLKKQNIEHIGAQNGGVQLLLDTEEFIDEKEVQFTFKVIYSHENLPTDAFEHGIIVDFSLIKDGKQSNQMSKSAKLTFDLDYFDFGSDINYDNISIFRYDDELAVWVPVGGVYNEMTNSISTLRNHLSQYTVMQGNQNFRDTGELWAQAEITSLLNKGIIESSDTFRPEDSILIKELETWVSKAYMNDNSVECISEEVASNVDFAIIVANALREYDLNYTYANTIELSSISNDIKSNGDLTDIAFALEMELIQIDENGDIIEKNLTRAEAASLLKKIYG